MEAENNRHRGRDPRRGDVPSVPALEPSWAVVNCAGIFREVRTGDRLRLDGPRPLVEIVRD
jgi:hypothetical protein